MIQLYVCIYIHGFPGGSVVNNPPANAGDPGLIPGTGRSGEGNSNPLQYSCLEKPMDGGAWWATVQEDVKYSSLWSTVGPCCLSVLYVKAYLC